MNGPVDSTAEIVAELDRLRSARDQWGREAEEHDRTKAALRRCQELYQLIVDNSLEGICVVQNEFVRWTNARCAEMFGLSFEEFTGNPVGTWIHPEDRAMILESHRQRMAGFAGPKLLAFRIIIPDGRIKWLQAAAMFVTWENRPASLAFVTDITERHLAEEELSLSRDRLILAQRTQAMGALAGGLAHDLRNDLGVIRSNVELAVDHLPADHPVLPSMRLALRAVERSTRLIRQVLTFGKQADNSRGTLAAGPLVREAVRLLGLSLPEGVEIDQSISADGAEIHMEPDHLHQIVMNLGLNAIQAVSVSGGHVWFRLAASHPPEPGKTHCPLCAVSGPGPFIELTVSDNGPGIDPEVVPSIFEPFFSTKPAGQGTGLGLAVVHHLVVIHKGALVLETAPGLGTTFRIYLPLAETSGKAIGLKSGAGRSYRVLLAEDIPLLCQSISLILKHMGHEVTTAQDGQQAWEYFAADPDRFDLVITDMIMPRMDGLGLARLVRDLRPRRPVVLMTGFSGAITEEQIMAVGFRGVMCKPISTREWTEMLNGIAAEEI